MKGWLYARRAANPLYWLSNKTRKALSLYGLALPPSISEEGPIVFRLCAEA